MNSTENYHIILFQDLLDFHFFPSTKFEILILILIAKIEF